MNHSITIITFLLCMIPAHCLDIAELQSHLLTSHPLFRSSQLKEAAYREAAKSESSLPDPMVRIGLFPGELVTRNGPVQSRFGLHQKIPNPSLLRWKRKGMEASAHVEGTRERQLRFELIRKLKIAFFEYWHLMKSIEIVNDNLELSRTWADLIKAHYSYHNYLYPTLLNLQVETLKLENQAESLLSKRAILSDQILNLAWIPGDEILPWPTWDRDVEEPPGLEDLQISNNPALLVLEARFEKKDAAIELAKSQDSLSYQVGAEWTRIGSDGFGADPGKDAWMVSAGVKLPLQRGAAQARIQKSRLQKQALEQEREALERTLRTRQQEYLVTLVDSIREILLIQDKLLPKASEAMTSLKSTYQTGDIDYFSLLENLRLTLDLNLAMANHKKNYWQTLAKLEELCGVSMFPETEELTP